MAKITLKKFSLDEALNGASIGWAVDGNMNNGLDRVAYNFRKGGAGYKYTVNTLTYECNSSGVPFDGDMSKRLYMVVAELEETRGTAASRGEGDSKEEVSIDALQPREQFAMEAMRAIIGSFEDPLHVDTNTVISIADKSFEFAQAMMTKAAEIRAEKKTGDVEQKLDIDSANLTSVTEKILYNMQLTLDEFKKCIKEEKIQLTIDELKKCLKDEKLHIEVKNENLPVVVKDVEKDVPVALKTVEGDVPVNINSTAGELPVTGSVSVDGNVDVTVTNPVDVVVTNTVDVNFPQESTPES